MKSTISGASGPTTCVSWSSSDGIPTAAPAGGMGMKVPVSWLKELVDIQLPIEQLAQRITLAGLEVEEIRYVGLPLPAGPVAGHTGERRAAQSNITGLAWDRERVVVGQILEVMPHPNADRLVLCRLEDGEREPTVLA